MQLYALYESIDRDTIIPILANWVNTQDRERLWLRLSQLFQRTLNPDIQILTLHNILIFGHVKTKERAKDEEPSVNNIEARASVDLRGLAYLLSTPAALESSLPLLEELKLSFHRALRPNNQPLSSLFTTAIGLRELENELYTYAYGRLQGKGHREAHQTFSWGVQS